MTLRLGDLIVIALMLIGATVGRELALDDHAAKTRMVVVVVAPCAELDAVGYDGLRSCIDEHGEVVRPGG